MSTPAWIVALTWACWVPACVFLVALAYRDVSVRGSHARYRWSTAVKAALWGDSLYVFCTVAPLFYEPDGGHVVVASVATLITAAEVFLYLRDPNDDDWFKRTGARVRRAAGRLRSAVASWGSRPATSPIQVSRRTHNVSVPGPILDT